MAADNKAAQDDYATLWRALCWLAYDNLHAHDPDSDRGLRDEIQLAWDIQGHKAALLEAVRDSKLPFEGRLGARCDPPPAPADTWHDFHWTGHAEDYGPIKPKDWPSEFNTNVLNWEDSVLRTARGEFIDVRCSVKNLRAWHPGPRGEQEGRTVRRGRKTGSGSFEAKDAPLIEEMKRLIDGGEVTSVHAAAMMVVEQAVGGGVALSKAKRLSGRYTAQFG